MVPDPSWSPLVEHLERCLEKFGIEPRGVDWPNGRDLEARFAVALDLLAGWHSESLPVVLDLGCGPGLMLDYLAASASLDRIEYQGVDLSERMVEAARSRWPDHQFSARDVVSQPLDDLSVDFVIMNGIMTTRPGIERPRMVELSKALITAAFRAARVGIAFNVMSKHVDWERDDLFHWGFDEVAAFLKGSVSRHYAFRADYGLYEFTCLVWREPRRPSPLSPAEWWRR